MCGIAGFVTDGEADADLLHSMCDSIRHRGPDDEGYFIDGGVGLGVRRLAIIDVKTGHQPIQNEDGTITVIFNGEIYNFPQLRSDLEAKGHRFATSTDTECIVHLYEEYADRCVEHMRGMFAFALWDARQQRLLLARDRVGKKPLYYRLTDRGIWFASELKALLQDPSLARELDLVALHHYLTFQYVPAPWSIYKGVRKLPPGHTASYRAPKFALDRYWRLKFADKLVLSEDEAAEQLKDRILDATRSRLISERPLGAFLSGGVDSSVVVAAMAETMSGPVKTFSVGFEDKNFDERYYARLVAERFGTDHHELIVRPNVLDVLGKLVWHYDEPFADSSAIPSYYVAEAARKSVTVVLNGDGGDESFAGYDRYVANLMASKLRIPGRLQPLIGRILKGLPDGRRPGSFYRRAKRFSTVLLEGPETRYAHMMSYFANYQKQTLYSPEMSRAVGDIDSYGLLRQAFSESDAPDLVDATLDVDVNTYLPGDLLAKMDIATMANSLEARSPLLDHKVMEFAAALPSHMKIRGRSGKYILKKAARDWLPKEILTRRKMGFGVPLATWLRGDLRDLTHDSLTDSTARSRGYFEPSAVNKLLAQHEGGIDHSPRIWALLWLELWHRTFIDNHATTMPGA